MAVVLVTGSSGLVGSECVRHFDVLGHAVCGIDGNQRKRYFGPDGDTTATRERLLSETRLAHYRADVRDRAAVARIVRGRRPELIVHCAAQPSHDWAATDPHADFETNAVGTLNLLEAARKHAPDCAFVFLSTNKVYGDAPNRLPLVEVETRYECAPAEGQPRRRRRRPGLDEPGELSDGIDETLGVDQSTHSLFGCSKLAADLLVQEYGRNFGMKTVCFRAGCLTGGAHAAAVQHGFLAYLARCLREGREYVVYGHKGKQVRDNLHAHDVARAAEAFWESPKKGEVYNLGGGRENSLSVLEAISFLEGHSGGKLAWRYEDTPRTGDHVWYVSDTSKFRAHYPGWSVTRNLDSIAEDLCRTP